MNKFFLLAITVNLITAFPAGETSPLTELTKPLVGDLSLDQPKEATQPVAQNPVDTRALSFFPPPPPPPPSSGGTNIDIVNTVIVDGCSRRGGKCNKKRKHKYKDYDDYSDNDYDNDYKDHDDYDNYNDYDDYNDYDS
ncbi:hypothetical protein K502DRAFT_330672 [Neoconidiobolus thromboides FSU 785]|nr:hypothetical protein K502DRAFT_330672 [Neoconidiobolus thromboides FSU 785]